MAYHNLLVETADSVATLTVNRPDKLNALNRETIEELHACVNALRSDATVRVVVITGAGEKAFVAGADIEELSQLTAVTAEALAARGQELMWKIENMGKPIIAAVNGYALGGGCELALACSFRYASSNAQLGLPETGLGLIPGYGGTQRLPRLIGRGRACEMILTGATLTAEQALATGLVNRVLEPPQLMPAVLEVAGAVASKSAGTLRLALKAINEGANMTLDAACRLEAALFGVVGGSTDAREGCAAFLEKRKPKFGNS